MKMYQRGFVKMGGWRGDDGGSDSGGGRSRKRARALEHAASFEIEHVPINRGALLYGAVLILLMAMPAIWKILNHHGDVSQSWLLLKCFGGGLVLLGVISVGMIWLDNKEWREAGEISARVRAAAKALQATERKARD